MLPGAVGPPGFDMQPDSRLVDAAIRSELGLLRLLLSLNLNHSGPTCCMDSEATKFPEGGPPGASVLMMIGPPEASVACRVILAGPSGLSLPALSLITMLLLSGLPGPALPVAPPHGVTTTEHQWAAPFPIP